ncbi:hypothetical protein AALP_AA8G181900 [Arabis alpina]|uniref:ATP-dependent RNA helicase n=1 Tax=Arabis alpina TaxID=50452 RepID=A0A087G7T0_ARAAL|nr:hypothetical protein AALP_AA8G181900 [Arabis alpina]
MEISWSERFDTMFRSKKPRKRADSGIHTSSKLNPFDSDDELDDDDKHTLKPSNRITPESYVHAKSFSSNAFDDDDDEKVEKRFSKPSLTSDAKSRYRNSFPDSGGCFKVAEDMRSNATRTLVKLNDQGEKLTRTHYKAVDINRNLSRGEKILGRLGGIFSRTWKPKKTRSIIGLVITRGESPKRRVNHLESREKLDYKVIIFCTIAMVTKLVAELLGKLSLNVREIHSRKPQSYRTRVSDEFRKSKGIILVTSDVSARGVYYPDVSLVVPMGLPSDRDQYVHRLGRTGRKGKEGEGVLLLAPWEEYFPSSVKNLPITKSPLPPVDYKNSSDFNNLLSIDFESQRVVDTLNAEDEQANYEQANYDGSQPSKVSRRKVIQLEEESDDDDIDETGKSLDLRKRKQFEAAFDEVANSSDPRKRKQFEAAFDEVEDGNSSNQRKRKQFATSFDEARKPSDSKKKKQVQSARDKARNIFDLRKKKQVESEVNKAGTSSDFRKKKQAESAFNKAGNSSDPRKGTQPTQATHYIDRNWKLNNKILAFCALPPPHTEEDEKFDGEDETLPSFQSIVDDEVADDDEDDDDDEVDDDDDVGDEGDEGDDYEDESS